MEFYLYTAWTVFLHQTKKKRKKCLVEVHWKLSSKSSSKDLSTYQKGS